MTTRSGWAARVPTSLLWIVVIAFAVRFGYILVAFLAGRNIAVEAVAFYLVAYTVTTLGAFGIVTVLSNPERDADALEDYRGLFWRRPVMAGAFTAMLLSLAGIPATVGFLAKFYVLAAGTSAAIVPLLIVLVVTSAIGLFYYLRIIVALYSEAPRHAAQLPTVYPSGGFILAVLTILLIWFGVYPAPLLNLIRNTMRGLL